MDAMKKILFVVEAMGGGVFTYVVDLANELCKSYEIYVAYAVRQQTPEDFKEYFDKSIRLIEVKNFTRSINPIKDFRAIPEVKRIAQKIHPDIIHLHSSKAGVIGRIAFNGKNVPLYYTPHGYSFLMKNYNPMKRQMFHLIEAVMAKRNCTTISCSPGEHQETLKLTSKATYVNNGINTEELDRVLGKVQHLNHSFTVFTLGRICYQKNPKLFNAVAEALPKIHFLWIGDGELRGELKSPNIEITGWIDRGKALELGYNADVFILTSLWEGLPISLLEAMYMRKLCIVNDVIGNHDVIESGKNGFVCRTVDEFKKAIEEENVKSLIDKAYEDIVTDYNTTVMGKKYAQIYIGGMEQSVFSE